MHCSQEKARSPDGKEIITAQKAPAALIPLDLADPDNMLASTEKPWKRVINSSDFQCVSHTIVPPTKSI